MSLFGNSKFHTHLSVPSLFGGKSSSKRDVLACNNNQLSGPDADLDLELSFASTMSLNSPARDSQPLTPEDENPNHVPMDISPAPARVFQVPQPPVQASNSKPIVGRPRAATSAARLFGRDMSNGYETNTLYSASSVSKSGTGTSSTKRLQRSALPTQWFSSSQPQQDENASSRPVDIPSSPVDPMDVDTSFSLASSAPDVHTPPLSAAPTITTFNFSAARASFGTQEPISAAPTVTTFNNLFYEVGSPSRDENVLAAPADISGVSSISESPCQPFPKKRRSSSPDRKSLSLRQSHQHLFADADQDLTSSPAQSSPTVHKLERMASNSLLTNQKKPTSLGLGMPPSLALNANKKRPRRPALSAMITPGEGPSSASPQPQTAYPVLTNQEDSGEGAEVHHRLPPVRRAFSAMLPPNLLDQTMMTMSSDASFEQDSSPAQAYANRQQVKTIRRCDGTDDFRPITGATALMKRDTEAMALERGLRRSEERENRGQTVAERDTPRSKYLGAGPRFGGFGDNEAHGKVLPCNRVREDGLMRINPTTMNELLDGKYDSKLVRYIIIDCRFDYEYLGGHIPGAININNTARLEEFLLGMAADKPEPSTSGDPSRKTILVFHCEFSVKRAPTFAKHLRSKDRAMNNHVYPRVHFPELYILEGGYSQYYSESGARCQPPHYVRMDDPHYAASRKEDLDQFRKGKFGRTKSYAYGEAKMLSMTSAAQQVQAAQPKRSSAPSGSLFAAATAARSRRGGLQPLVEDGSVDYESDGGDTDIGDSPCPPPTKGVVFKGKKMGRAPLARAETYGPARIGMGY
ncbi:hypothetical protein LXA43DRAFT_974805 [Ganoderma leucocontextum]|nr:hypothetical protein LXA43DRAFT_974805 [Ganoderma leucocontextum]